MTSYSVVKKLGWFVISLILFYFLLLIPDSTPQLPDLPDRQPFVWDQDDYWSSLENAFVEANGTDRQVLAERIDSTVSQIHEYLFPFAFDTVSAEAPLLSHVLDDMFSIAPMVAVCPEKLPEYIETYTLIRRIVKDQSARWDMDSAPARDALYRLLYGGRTAVEQVLLQLPEGIVPPMFVGDSEPSATPSCELLGIKVHSGDLLVSRGGAPTSALIARGSDYPGNFSHVALLHVDSSGIASIIESHIEIGVAVATIEQYLADKKLRIMVLRLRSDHPALLADPMLPHKAASLAFERANSEHIPYDFEMDFADPSTLFCSEVASSPYRDMGVDLWMGISRISSEGVASWLAAFGVRNFVTQEPSDLEYDPQLRVVAEWRNPETLWQDQIDNAILDAMLEGAERGDRIKYDWYLLPIGRVLKAWSWFKNQFGEVGPIPEGMSTSAALRNDWFSRRHAAIKAGVQQKADRFISEEGYKPPYWELVSMARTAIGDT